MLKSVSLLIPFALIPLALTLTSASRVELEVDLGIFADLSVSNLNSESLVFSEGNGFAGKFLNFDEVALLTYPLGPRPPKYYFHRTLPIPTPRWFCSHPQHALSFRRRKW